MKIGKKIELLWHMPLGKKLDADRHRTGARSINPLPVKLRRTRVGPQEAALPPRVSIAAAAARGTPSGSGSMPLPDQTSSLDGDRHAGPPCATIGDPLPPAGASSMDEARLEEALQAIKVEYVPRLGAESASKGEAASEPAEAAPASASEPGMSIAAAAARSASSGSGSIPLLDRTSSVDWERHAGPPYATVEDPRFPALAPSTDDARLEKAYQAIRVEYVPGLRVASASNVDGAGEPAEVAPATASGSDRGFLGPFEDDAMAAAGYTAQEIEKVRNYYRENAVEPLNERYADRFFGLARARRVLAGMPQNELHDQMLRYTGLGQDAEIDQPGARGPSQSNPRPSREAQEAAGLAERSQDPLTSSAADERARRDSDDDRRAFDGDYDSDESLGPPPPR